MWSWLQLQVYPCPKGSSKHREMVRSFGGTEQYDFFPVCPCVPCLYVCTKDLSDLSVETWNYSLKSAIARIGIWGPYTWGCHELKVGLTCHCEYRLPSIHSRWLMVHVPNFLSQVSLSSWPKFRDLNVWKWYVSFDEFCFVCINSVIPVIVYPFLIFWTENHIDCFMFAAKCLYCFFSVWTVNEDVLAPKCSIFTFFTTQESFMLVLLVFLVKPLKLLP